MALAPGARLGVYEVVGRIGEGGMGQVYRGTDTTLGRPVAIKVLPEAFAAAPDRVARFEREARTLASLSHANIAGVYGFEKSGGVHALVMELVEGEDLGERLVRGAIPFDEALPIALQLADALAAAHEQGIVHRDLKPANIKVSPSGHVKVLDFGLAKAIEPAPASSASATTPLTITTPAMTQAGMILGTAAYMSPEQARGLAVTRRADIWAFGCVLYEMLTGIRPFEDEDVSLTLSKLLRAEPDYAALPDGVPPRVVAVVKRCLMKDPRQRAADMHDVRLALEGAFESPVAPDRASPAETPRGGRPAALAPVMAAALLAFGAAWTFKPGPPPAAPAGGVVRSAMNLPVGQSFSNPGYPSVAMAPDGSRLAYVANGQLWVRALTDLDATPVPGTQGVSPAGIAFSPDSAWLTFYSSLTRAIVRIPVAGGAVVPITRVDTSVPVWGLRWESDDTILYVRAEGIERVAASGGTPVRLIEADAAVGEVLDAPQLLPGGRAILFAANRRGEDWAYWRNASVVVQEPGSTERRVVWSGGAFPRYLPSGHLVFARDGALMAVPFDTGRLAVSGTPVQVLSSLETTTSILVGGLGAHYSVSRDGTLAYAPARSFSVDRVLVWVDRSGQEEKTGIPPGRTLDPDVSPDGKRIAYAVEDASGNTDIWVADVSGAGRRRITTHPETDRYPLWTADSRSLLFYSTRDGLRGVYRASPDIAGADERVYAEAGRTVVPWALTDGDRTILTTELAAGGVSNFDIGLLTVGREVVRTALLESPRTEAQPGLSPDRRWLAYQITGGSDSGIFVRPFPGVAASVEQMSPAAGVEPVWARGGRELLYRNNDAIVAVPIETGPRLRAGAPQVLFRGVYYNEVGRQWTVTPDGNRFLMLKRVRPDAATDQMDSPGLVLVQRWFDELQRLVPVAP